MAVVDNYLDLLVADSHLDSVLVDYIHFDFVADYRIHLDLLILDYYKYFDFVVVDCYIRFDLLTADYYNHFGFVIVVDLL